MFHYVIFWISVENDQEHQFIHYKIQSKVNNFSFSFAIFSFMIIVRLRLLNILMIMEEK